MSELHQAHICALSPPLPFRRSQQFTEYPQNTPKNGHRCTILRNPGAYQGKVCSVSEIQHIEDRKQDTAIDEGKHTALMAALNSLDTPMIASLLLKSASIPNSVLVHEHIISVGLEQDTFLCSLLVTAYGNCGWIQMARALFDRMHYRNVITWTTMVRAYADHGHPKEAIDVFKQMCSNDCEVIPNEVSFLTAIGACSNLDTLDEGSDIHCKAIEHGLNANVLISTALIKMYTEFGMIEQAWNVFIKLDVKDVICWTAIIGAYVQQGMNKEALQLYQLMETEHVQPNDFTFVSFLNACANLGDLSQGKAIHKQISQKKVHIDNVLGTALINMYGKCGDLNEAQFVFNQMHGHDSMAWTALIAVYSLNGETKKAYNVLQEMNVKNARLSAVAVPIALGICADLKLLKHGQEIHGSTVMEGLDSDIAIQNSILHLYGKCGQITEACAHFYQMTERNVVSWTTMMGAFLEQGCDKEVIDLFSQMQEKGLTPDEATFVHVLKACSNLLMLEQGWLVHALLVSQGIMLGPVIGTSLVDMYANCGAVEHALSVFRNLNQYDEGAWNRAIMACAQEGHGKKAIQLFEEMKGKNISPSGATFVSLLCACSHSGMVNEGCLYFESIRNGYGIMPTVEHYGCMVDLLGRGGHLEMAEDFIENSPVVSNGCMWSALLGACKKYKDVERATRVAKRVMACEPWNAAPYMLLSSTYATNGRWYDAQTVLKDMVKRGLRKKPGCTLVEVNNKVHKFNVNDRLNADEKVYNELEKLEAQVKEIGYVPETKLVLHDVDEELKQHLLGRHSERIALAFGLLNTVPGKTVRLAKNLRTCVDCHNMMKPISKIVDREIILRDTNRIHHFKNGVCSCGDYW